MNAETAKFSDTGLWRLIMTIEESGMSAFLKNTVGGEGESETVRLFSRNWDKDNDRLLSRIEETIYDNPRVLEDFSTHIVITASKSLWIPENMTEDGEFDDKFYTTVFPAEHEDIFSDFNAKEVCAYTLVPGLKSFLQRSLPGCRISSHLTLLKETFETLEMKRIEGVGSEREESVYVNIRDGQVDIFAFCDGNFLCGVTHECRDASDMAYKLLLTSFNYRFDSDKAKLMIVGNENEVSALNEIAGEIFPNTFHLDRPTFCSGMGVPLSTALAAGYRLDRP